MWWNRRLFSWHLTRFGQLVAHPVHLAACRSSTIRFCMHSIFLGCLNFWFISAVPHKESGKFLSTKGEETSSWSWSFILSSDLWISSEFKRDEVSFVAIKVSFVAIEVSFVVIEVPFVAIMDGMVNFFSRLSNLTMGSGAVPYLLVIAWNFMVASWKFDMLLETFQFYY